MVHATTSKLNTNWTETLRDRDNYSHFKILFVFTLLVFFYNEFTVISCFVSGQFMFSVKMMESFKD